MLNLQYLAKESAVLIAFVVLGSLLLLSFWIADNVNKQLLSEFKHDKISVVLEEGANEDFRAYTESEPGIIRYEIQSGEDNKALLTRLYPELQSVLNSLQADFFPLSATLTVTHSEQVLDQLAALSGVIETQILHRPPDNLRQFLNVVMLVFSLLWVLTLVLVLYFQLERLSFQEGRKWSLMKMLGAKPMTIFWPICAGQLARISIASVLAVFLAAVAARQFEMVFQWSWPAMSVGLWASFLVGSLLLSGMILYALFAWRFRKVSLG